jgi:hypothetical protein
MEAPTTELPNTPTKEMDENVTYTLLNHIQGKIGSRWAVTSLFLSTSTYFEK